MYRVAIVLTDGKSNKNSWECGWNTLQAAKALHQLTPTILVYVIGITDNVNDTELKAIATSPKFVSHLKYFNGESLKEAQESHTEEVCRRGECS